MTISQPMFGRATGPRLLLADHHHALEAGCLALLACASSDEPADLLEQVRDFEREVNEHLAIEEESMFPAYAIDLPAEAKILRDDHARIRQLLFEIGIDAELHELRYQTISELVELLRTHGARENATLYPWAEAHLSDTSKQTLRRRVGRSLEAVEHVRAKLRALLRAH